MDIPPTGAPPAIFERIGEYQAVLASVDQLSLRRQNLTAVYMGLNALFLSALGIFISTHLNFTVWSTSVGVVIIAAAIAPLNWFWRRAIKLYDGFLTIRHDYLRSIEEEFRERRRQAGLGAIGLFSGPEKELIAGRQGDASKAVRMGNSWVDYVLARWFAFFYPVVAGLAILVTILVQNHVISPPTLP
jgi:hypothetical protein